MTSLVGIAIALAFMLGLLYATDVAALADLSSVVR
jgi:hypothetical protein